MSGPSDNSKMEHDREEIGESDSAQSELKANEQQLLETKMLELVHKRDQLVSRHQGQSTASGSGSTLLAAPILALQKQLLELFERQNEINVAIQRLKEALHSSHLKAAQANERAFAAISPAFSAYFQSLCPPPQDA